MKRQENESAVMTVPHRKALRKTCMIIRLDLDSKVNNKLDLLANKACFIALFCTAEWELAIVSFINLYKQDFPPLSSLNAEGERHVCLKMRLDQMPLVLREKCTSLS